MIRYEDAQAAVFKAVDDSLQFPHRQWIDAGEGFVKQDKTAVWWPAPA